MGIPWEVAGCLPLEKGQNAHVLPLRGYACGHFEAWSLVPSPPPAPPSSPPLPRRGAPGSSTAAL